MTDSRKHDQTKAFPLPENEAKRVEALKKYGLLDTAAEQSFDDFAQLAAYICGTPIALISLVDEERQWFKAKVGVEVSETPREHAFCAHAILSDEVMIVEDATMDQRFAHSPLVTSIPNIRFYAGAPLIDSDGFALGTLCVIDNKPHHIDEKQQDALQMLARQVVAQCEFRRVTSDMALLLAETRTLHGLLPICSHCKNIRNDEGYWNSVEEYIASHSDAGFSHGICPACTKLHHPQLYDLMLEKKRN